MSSFNKMNGQIFNASTFTDVLYATQADGGGGQQGPQGAGFANTDYVRIATQAGRTNQGTQGVAVGFQAGLINQGAGAIAVGANAGSNYQGITSVAIGVGAGFTGQGSNANAYGTFAGAYNQGADSIAIGTIAGATAQSTLAIAIGRSAGSWNQGVGGVAIGALAGQTGQGALSVGIGTFAGQLNQASNSIALNATANALNPGTTGFFVNPIRGNTGGTGMNALFYNQTTSEIFSLPSNVTQLTPYVPTATNSAQINVGSTSVLYYLAYGATKIAYGTNFTATALTGLGNTGVSYVVTSPLPTNYFARINTLNISVNSAEFNATGAVLNTYTIPLLPYITPSNFNYTIFTRNTAAGGVALDNKSAIANFIILGS